MEHTYVYNAPRTQPNMHVVSNLFIIIYFGYQRYVNDLPHHFKYNIFK